VRNFVPAILFSIACLVLAAWYAIESGKPLATVMSLVIILGILEISLSFDNAIVNAAALNDIDKRLQRYFLISGILIAVFGMRLVFPIVILTIVIVALVLSRPQKQCASHLMSNLTSTLQGRDRNIHLK
jgi:hypothetical protein